MSSSGRIYNYRAVDPNGKSRKGEITARDETDAFAKLKADQLLPLDIRIQSHDQIRPIWSRFTQDSSKVKSTDLEALLTNLSVLLRAGADIRTALKILDGDEKEIGHPLKDVAKRILSGSSLEAALTPVFSPSQSHLGALIAAGESRGDLPSGLEAAARVLASRRMIHQQLLEALSYPVFVFMTAIAALTVILLVVVPAIAPLLEESGQAPPLYFRIIVSLSQFLQWGWGYILAGTAAILFVTIIGYRFGNLKHVSELWWLDGPLSRIVQGLIYGGFARSVGDTLSGGSGIIEALQLGRRGVGSALARRRLEVVTQAIRQGHRLSEALAKVKGFPAAITKLTEVGEASGQLGPMLARAGERSEKESLHHIEKISKILGPALILALGLMIGALMGGVLTALTDIGSVAGG
jgi:general secretion pathway protein F